MSKTTDHLNAIVQDIVDKNLLSSPMALAGEVNIPSFIAVAFLTKWLTAFKGLATVGGQIGDFANFRPFQTDEPMPIRK